LEARHRIRPLRRGMHSPPAPASPIKAIFDLGTPEHGNLTPWPTTAPPPFQPPSIANANGSALVQTGETDLTVMGELNKLAANISEGRNMSGIHWRVSDNMLGMFLGVSSYSVGPLTASAFSIVVLGGLGSVSGSLIAAFVVGYLETLTAYLVSPAYRTIPALLLLVIVMYIRPQGLLGRR